MICDPKKSQKRSLLLKTLSSLNKSQFFTLNMHFPNMGRLFIYLFLVLCAFFFCKQYPQGKKSPKGALFFWRTVSKSPKKCVNRDESARLGSLHGSMLTSPLTNSINHAKICSVSQNIPRTGPKIFESDCRIISHLCRLRLISKWKDIIISLWPSIKVMAHFSTFGHVNSLCPRPLGVRNSPKCWTATMLQPYWNNNFMCSCLTFYFRLKTRHRHSACNQSAIGVAEECWPAYKTDVSPMEVCVSTSTSSLH